MCFLLRAISFPNVQSVFVIIIATGWFRNTYTTISWWIMGQSWGLCQWWPDGRNLGYQPAEPQQPICQTVRGPSPYHRGDAKHLASHLESPSNARNSWDGRNPDFVPGGPHIGGPLYPGGIFTCEGLGEIGLSLIPISSVGLYPNFPWLVDNITIPPNYQHIGNRWIMLPILAI